MDAIPGYSFTPDGSAIVISYGGEFWKVPMTGAAPAKIPFTADVDVAVGPEVKFEYPIEDTPTFNARQIRDAVPSPDGKRIAFTALDRIYVADLAGDTPRRLTTENVGEYYPAWSPDGSQVAYVTWTDAGGYLMKVSAAGRVFRGKTGPEVLGLLGVPPDFTADSKAVSYIHRVVGDVDLYFVPNLSRKPLWPVTCSFRVQGKVPELWWPATGRIERAGWYCQKNGRTEMPLLLRPEESVFVVFRPATEGVDPAVALTCDGKPAMASVTVGDKGSLRLTSRKAGEYLVTTAAGRTLSARVDDLLPEIALNGPWRVTFEPGRGAPPEIQLDQLRSWHEHADAGVRYPSGKGTYHAKIHIPPPSLGPGRRLWLNQRLFS